MNRRPCTLFSAVRSVVPSMARSQYDSDGVAYGSPHRIASPADESVSSSTPLLLSSTILSSGNMTDVQELNRTSTKRTLKKGASMRPLSKRSDF